MKDFPFSVYDFFAYLASGLLLLLIASFAFDISWTIPKEATLQFIIAIVAAYTLGQVLGYVSGVLIEQYFVGNFLGRTDTMLLGLEAKTFAPCNIVAGKIHRCRVDFDEPEHAGLVLSRAREAVRKCVAINQDKIETESRLLILGMPAAFVRRCQLRTLLRGHRSRWLRRHLFNHAFEPLPESTRHRVLKRAKSEDVPTGGLFSKAFAIAKADESTLTRLNTFLYLYGFARNMCAAFAIGALLLAVGAVVTWWQGFAINQPKLWAALLSLILSFIMLFRYLDFHRRYGAEVFNAYAYPAAKPERLTRRASQTD